MLLKKVKKKSKNNLIVVKYTYETYNLNHI